VVGISLDFVGVGFAVVVVAGACASVVAFGPGAAFDSAFFASY